MSHGGRIIGVITMIATIVILAFPITILGTVFMVVQQEEDEEQMRREVCQAFYIGLRRLIATELSGAHTCEGCGNLLSSGEQFCRRCGRRTGAEGKRAETEDVRDDELIEQRKCAACGNALLADAQFCRKCGRAAALDGGGSTVGNRIKQLIGGMSFDTIDIPRNTTQASTGVAASPACPDVSL
eukprot:gene9118-39409_t